MTVDEIVRETRQWPASQVKALVDALKVEPGSAVSTTNTDAVTRLCILSEKIGAIWDDAKLDIATEQMIASLRESRSRRE
jgi:hypothetical protein